MLVKVITVTMAEHCVPDTGLRTFYHVLFESLQTSFEGGRIIVLSHLVGFVIAQTASSRSLTLHCMSNCFLGLWPQA